MTKFTTNKKKIKKKKDENFLKDRKKNFQVVRERKDKPQIGRKYLHTTQTKDIPKINKELTFSNKKQIIQLKNGQKIWIDTSQKEYMDG